MIRRLCLVSGFVAMLVLPSESFAECYRTGSHTESIVRQARRLAERAERRVALAERQAWRRVARANASAARQIARAAARADRAARSHYRWRD